MGTRDWVNSAGDWFEDAAESATATAGEIAGSGLDGLSGLARRIGADDVAQALDDFGDEIASITGGEVRERELGESRDPTELIRGEPSAIRDVAGKLRNLATSIESTGSALRTINVADWTGEAATAFHSEFEKQPQLWFTAADAMTNCAATLDDWWYWAVVAAQAKAQNAIDKWDEADRAEQAFNALPDEFKRKLTRADDTLRDEARTILSEARDQRDSAAAGVVAAIAGYTDAAPAEPPFTDRWDRNLSDLDAIAEHADFSAVSGLLTSLTGIVQFVRAVNPTDTYNLAHPGEYLTNLSGLGTGLVVAAADPGAVTSAFLSDVRRNPFEFAGALTGDALLMAATGGTGGTAKVAVTTLKRVDDAISITRRTPDLIHKWPTTPTDSVFRRGDSPWTTTAATPDNVAESSGGYGEAPPTHAVSTELNRADNPAAQLPDSGQPAGNSGATTDSLTYRADQSNPGDTDARGDGGALSYSPENKHDLGDIGPGPHPDSEANGTNPPHDIRDGGAGIGPRDTHTNGSDGGAATNSVEGPQPQPNSDPGARAGADIGVHHAAENGGAETNRVPDQCETGRDPVDIATGEFLLPEIDLVLPGVLPLRLTRRHRSNYRFGRWFGPSWSATIDMRIVVEQEGVTFLGEAGMMLAYPHAEVDIAVLPTTGGQDWTLTRTGSGGYRVRDPERELIWHFAPEPALGGMDAQLGSFAISAITDRHRNRIRFHYAANGAPVAITHSGGYRVEIGTSDSRITTLTVMGSDQAGMENRTRVRTFAYESGNLIAVTNAVAATVSYTYDEHARMLSWTDSNDTSMHNTYDESGRVIIQQGTGGILNSAFDYLDFPDGSGTLTTVTDSLGAVTTHGFDHDLRLRDLVEPSGARTHYDYNADRKLLKVVAPDGATTHFGYTGDGDVTRITRPDGASINIDYVWRNRPSGIADADGIVRQQEWDGNGNLTAVIDADGVRKEHHYHPNGALAEVLAPTGARTASGVNPAGLAVSITGADGTETRIIRDCFGRPVRITDPLGASTVYEWSLEGQLSRRIDPDGYSESWAWDGEGNLLAHVDRAGGLTQFTYGVFDLLASRTDPEGSVTHYSWDTERRLVGVANPIGQTWVYEYDGSGRLTAETDYAGATTRYTYDRAGRVHTIAPATGVVRHHDYDILGRLVEVTAATGDWRRFTYDSAGRVREATTGYGCATSHRLEFEYTRTGLLASQRFDNQPAMTFDHDRSGRRVLRTAPSGTATGWCWDQNDRLRSLHADDRKVTFDYDEISRPIGWRIGEVAITRTLSDVGHVEAQEVTAFSGSPLALNPTRPGSRPMRRDTYHYRPDGYVEAHTHVDFNGTHTSRHYSLDAAGRVTGISRSGVDTESYTYDALGNMVTARTSGSSASRSDTRGEYRNNQLIRNGRTCYSYDKSGRLSRKTTTRLSRKPSVWHYEYDGFDQLISVITPDGQHWRYTYDALGRRVSKQRLTKDGAVSERVDYVWDGATLIEQAAGEMSIRWQYRPGTHIPITQTTDQEMVDREFHAIVSDLVGTPTELLDPDSGVSVATAVTDLWGNTTWHGTAETLIRFPGQLYDPETGLHYNFFRFYDPDRGRFLTSDPLGLQPAPNPNIYPRNPLVWSDPLGLIPSGCSVLMRTGADTYQSPAGLEYGPDPGPNFVDRADHVHNHANDIPSRPGHHGVFTSSSPDEIFELVDEGYLRAMNGQAVAFHQGPKMVYYINMERAIGLAGGQIGNLAGNPMLNYLQLVLLGNRVITAFPTAGIPSGLLG
ncbi:RHS repeat protein [Nocardia sp. 2]|uniref:RHS repeat protein n=1 Tax=Nocardia acididurans TaxID=2802282 RepID=A0ABS1MIB7_9NOCA|nr:DUF6531 domain-containing protein [Nocardia acididurans]MBL1079800.1 RHS repeat protein [Nocardia acididurans]